MANLVQVEANNILNASWGQTTYTALTTPVKVALITTTTASTATAAGSEVSGGAGPYARQSAGMGAASAGANSNASQINYTGMPACTVGGVESWDSAGTPVRKWFGTLSANKTVNAGDTFSIAAAALTASAS